VAAQPCPDCGGPKGLTTHGRIPKRCPECERKAYARPLRPAIPRDERKARHSAAMKASWARRKLSRTHQEKLWRTHVGRLTTLAMHLGFLPHWRDCLCVDCGAAAGCYDHRDYSQPLLVEPVCLGCNSKRGRGVMPPSLDSNPFRPSAPRSHRDRTPCARAGGFIT
jgi:hypothetical protein